MCAWKTFILLINWLSSSYSEKVCEAFKVVMFLRYYRYDLEFCNEKRMDKEFPYKNDSNCDTKTNINVCKCVLYIYRNTFLLCVITNNYTSWWGIFPNPFPFMKKCGKRKSCFDTHQVLLVHSTNIYFMTASCRFPDTKTLHFIKESFYYIIYIIVFKGVLFFSKRSILCSGKIFRPVVWYFLGF